MKKKIAIPLMVLLALVASSCGLASSKINELCLVYKGGIVQDAEFEKLLKPGSNNSSIGMGSSTYCYPIDQRTYIADVEGGDTTPVEAVSMDTVRLGVEYQLYFTLNQQEEVIQAFHENLGVKTEAWTPEGWTALLRQYFEPQIERSIEAAALNYNWRDLFSSEDTRREFQNTVVANVKNNLKEVIGGDYFCGPDYTRESDDCGDFKFTVGKPYPINQDIVIAIEDEQKAVTRTNSQAQENLRIQAEADGKRALVDLYGQDNAALIQLCEKNPEACSSIIVSSGAPVAVAGR